jgi:pseudoazurin
MNKKLAILVCAGVALIGLIRAPHAIAQDAAARSQVKMLNVGSDNRVSVFEPEIIHVAVGTSADFIAEDFGHDAAAVEGLIPAGAEQFVGYKNADLTVKFTVEGVYVYQCTSHQGAGMVGLVVVGNPKTNIDTILASYRASAALSQAAKEKIGALLERVSKGA